MLERRRIRRKFSPPPAPPPRRGIRHFIWGFIRRTCFVIGAFVLLSMLAGALSLGKPQAIPLPEKMVLFMPLKDGFSDLPEPPSLTDPFAPRAPGLQTQIDAIDRAAADPRVKGLIAYMEEGDFEITHTQEMRAAIKRFKEAGKFTIIYSDSYGEAGGGLGRFYLASIFEKRWMQPLGIVSVPGIRMEAPYFREALDKIGIEPQFVHRKNYKTVFESATNKTMSPQNREMLNQIMNDIRNDLVTNISADLVMTPEQFTALVHKGLFTADEALAAGLVTDINYDDALYDKITGGITGNPESEDPLYVDVATYAAHGHRVFHAPARKAALVYASGAIMNSAIGAGAPGLGGGNIIAANELTPLLFDLADDKSLGAIVLRIDSPGGSPVASENILRALNHAQKKGKKIIVSMGPSAASGGYWIASHADHIFALPGTLTGSIGVAGGKISAAGLWDQWGVNWDGVAWGENAALWSMNHPFSSSEAERINAMMDQVYDAFTARVAEGRKLSPEQVERVAQGRVWTGESARKNGLVDELGGLGDALDYTAKLLGAKDRADLAVEIVPEPKTALEELVSMVSRGAVFDNTILNVLTPVREALAVLSSGETFAYEPLKIK
ncbi:MAG: signal peptide peptidase SppA [Alphaproteobacteria bacterium]